MLICVSINSQYGTSEELIGEWMELRGNRDQMVIVTKVPVDAFLYSTVNQSIL